MDTTGWVDHKATLFCFPFPLCIFVVFLSCFFLLGAGQNQNQYHLQHSYQFVNHHVCCCWFHHHQGIHLKKHCQFLILHQRTFLLYRNHNQNAHNYSWFDSCYFFLGRFCLTKLTFLFYESVWCLHLRICDVSVKITFLIHLIKGLAYPSDSQDCHRPDVYIWTRTIPAAAVVWGKLSLKSSFLREQFLKGRSRKRLLSKIIRLFPIDYRSSHRRRSFKKAFISNFELFTGKNLCCSLFLIKL